jgi:hypothetical protein
MAIRLLGMMPPEVARIRQALDALGRHLPSEHAHVCRALQYIRMTLWPWGAPSSVRAYTGGPWGRGMILVHRPTTLPLEEIAVSVAHEARHIVLHPNGTHSYVFHAFGSRPPTPAERLADPIYARDDEVRRVLSAGLAREGVDTAPWVTPMQAVWGAWARV